MVNQLYEADKDGKLLLNFLKHRYKTKVRTGEYLPKKDLT